MQAVRKSSAQCNTCNTYHSFISTRSVRLWIKRGSSSIRHSAAAAASVPGSTSHSDASVDLSKLLTSRAYTPAPYVGPVAVQLIPGKRLGLVATRNLAVGEPLLVCCRPLVVLLGEQGHPPSNEELVEALMAAQLEPWQLAWLRLLLRGAAQHPRRPAGDASSSSSSSSSSSGGSSSSPVDPVECEGRPSDLADLAEAAALISGTWPVLNTNNDTTPISSGNPSSDASSSQVSASSTGSSSDPSSSNGTVAVIGSEPAGRLSILGVPCPLTRKEAERVVAQTAYAESSEDTVAAALKELTAESVAGVWQEFGLLNHSCAPNTCVAPFGTALVVRAAAPILAGEELTTCYLGERRLAPVRLRRAALRANYGFHCQCERCMAEQRAFPTNWYPQDAELLGMAGKDDGIGAQSAGGGSGGSDAAAGAEGAAGAAVAAWRWAQEWFGFGAAEGKRPVPSQDNFVLLQLFEAAGPGGPLAAEVQAAAAAPGARVAAQRRAAALVRAAAARRRLEAALDGLPRALAPAARRWLSASAFEILRLEADALDLFLSGGALPTAADLRRAEEAASGSGARRGWLGGLLRRLGGEEEDGGPAAGADDDERAEAAARRALRGRQLAVLSAAAEALDGVARGSELHLQYAVAALDVARALRGGASVEARAAELVCGKAHAARYGQLQAGTLAAAVAARRRQLLGASLSRRMSMLAWDWGES